MSYSISRNKFKIALFDNRRFGSYLELINQNLKLIRKLLNQKRKIAKPTNATNPQSFFIPRAKHLQIMTLIGVTSEYLIKIILLKRGYCINIVGTPIRNNDTRINTSQIISFSSNFIEKLKSFNKKNNFQYLNERALDVLYLSAKRDIYSNNLFYSSETYNFFQCTKKWKETNKSFHKNYLCFIKKFDLFKKYLQFSNLNKDNCLDIIRKSRNNYIHLAEPLGEVQGIYWYMYNYLVSILRIEFPKKFMRKKLIGDDKIKNCFKIK